MDRGALDAAMALGVPHGGWCPRGRRAEDGTIPLRYRLEECRSRAYPSRTLKNVLDSDGTLILNRGTLEGGTALTHAFAAEQGKPCLVISIDDDPAAAAVLSWLSKHGIRALNVAGPRESNAPGIERAAREFLVEVLAGDAG